MPSRIGNFKYYRIVFDNQQDGYIDTVFIMMNEDIIEVIHPKDYEIEEEEALDKHRNKKIHHNIVTPHSHIIGTLITDADCYRDFEVGKNDVVTRMEFSSIPI